MSLQDYPKLVEALAFLNTGFQKPVETFSRWDGDKRRTTCKYRDDENAALCYISEKGILASDNFSCYAGLFYHPPRLDWEESAIGIGSKLFFGGGNWRRSKYKPTDEQQIMYLDWVMNRSPYASIFLLHDAKEAFENGVVFGDANAPTNLMFFGLNATRYTHEYTQIVRMFCDLVAVGVNENLAFLICHSTIWDGDCGPVSIRPFDSGHCCLSGYSSQTLVTNFISNNPVYLTGNYKTENRYAGEDRIFGGGNNVAGRSYLVDKLKDVIKKVDVKKDVPNSNPFAANNPSDKDDSIEYKKFIDVISEHQDELIPNEKKKAA